jgi:hypothetical protein
MSKQPQKAYWKQHRDAYHRHSVEREVLRFMGWSKLLDLIEAAEREPSSFRDHLLFADALAIGFATAGRVSEWRTLTPDSIHVFPSYFEVRGMGLSKRYRKTDHVIRCLRCHTLNDKFATRCKECNANLIYGEKKQWQTKRLAMTRIPFHFPREEQTARYILRRLNIAKENAWPYLFYNPHTKQPVTPRCFYTHFVHVGEQVDLELWPHRERAERCKQLREEYDFTRDDIKRFTMIVAEKTLDVYAGTSIPYEKKMGIL